MSRILLVDDDATLRKGLRKALEHNRCLVEEASSVDEAIAKVSQHQFDLVILDHDLGSPGKTGVSLLLHFRENNLRIPTLFMSGNGVTPLEKIARGLGAGVFLSKPFGLEDFLASCRKMLVANAPAP